MRELIAQGGLFAVQTWYFGYVLAFVLALVTTLFVRLQGGKWHYILWLPAVIMAVICLVIKITDINLLGYFLHFRENGVFYSEGRTEGRQGLEAYIRYCNLNLLETRAISRWVRSSWYYIGAAAVFSGAGFLLYRVSLKGSRRRFLGRAAVILLVLLALCSADRHFAISAELLFVPQRYETHVFDDTKNELTILPMGAYITSEGNGLVWNFVYSGFGASSYEQKIINFNKDIIMYTAPSVKSDKLYIINDKSLSSPLKKETDIFTLKLIGIAAIPGWRYSIKYDNSEKDEMGRLLFKTIGGYIKINDILDASGRDRFIVRMNMLEKDVLMYIKGITVSPSIMYVFEPLEIYLLLPLSILSTTGWVVWVILDKLRLKKAHS